MTGICRYLHVCPVIFSLATVFSHNDKALNCNSASYSCYLRGYMDEEHIVSILSNRSVKSLQNTEKKQSCLPKSAMTRRNDASIPPSNQNTRRIIRSAVLQSFQNLVITAKTSRLINSIMANPAPTRLFFVSAISTVSFLSNSGSLIAQINHW